jgi:hypothetical protein
MKENIKKIYISRGILLISIIITYIAAMEAMIWRTEISKPETPIMVKTW